MTRKENAVDPKGTALFILTDASASMGGTKYNVTAAAVALLNDAVSPLGVPLEIGAFTERGSIGTVHFIIKKFSEKRSSENILSDYAKMRRELSQNADGDSIMWAYRRLIARPEERKILLVLSDGSPASDNPGDCWTYTNDVIAEVGKRVECYGIGIMDESVSHLYPEYSVLRHADELEQCLLDVVKKKIFTN
jgi:cobaltochelatase CobT